MVKYIYLKSTKAQPVLAKSILFNHSTISYRVTGSGKPVVLIHGFGEDGDIWQKQAEALQQQYLLIIPDLPGSGQSELIPGADIETYAEIIKLIIEAEWKAEYEGVAMLGHSLGGYITLCVAEKYPQLLSAFGLVHSTAYADSEEKKTARRKSIEFIRTYGAYDFLRTAIPGLFGTEWSAGHQAAIEALVEKGRNFSPEALIQYYEAMIARPDRTEVLRNFPRPILFIMGLHDNAVPFTQSMQQCYLPRLSHVHILRNSAHMGMWEETGLVNHFFLSFLG